MASPIKKVVLVGAHGLVGSVILKHLLEANYTVTAITRSGSSHTALPSSVTQVTVPSTFPVSDLTTAIHGHDAVIAAFPVKDVDQHLRLTEAAHAAGVRRYIPSDYGSVEATHPMAEKYIPLYLRKERVRQRCVELEGSVFSWTSLVCGHFYDSGFEDGYLHMDIPSRTAHVLDGGDVKASASTLNRVGEAVVRVLQREGETRNRKLLVQSFCVSQNETLAAVERATGEKWNRVDVKSEAHFEENGRKYSLENDPRAFVELVFALGTLYSNWTGRDELAMEALGLQDEDLDTVVKEVVEKIK